MGKNKTKKKQEASQIDQSADSGETETQEKLANEVAQKVSAVLTPVNEVEEPAALDTPEQKEEARDPALDDTTKLITIPAQSDGIENPFKDLKSEYVSSLGPDAGTPNQQEIIEDYPYESFQDKLMIPYIERFNGNICVKRQEWHGALRHYSKALFGLKQIFDGDRSAFIQSREDAVKYIAEIEIPCCLNLAHCYLKIEDYHHAIKYTSQVLENDGCNVKAFFRRGVAYTKIGEIKRANDDLKHALDMTQDNGEKTTILRAMQDVRELQQRNKVREKEAASRMFKFPESKKPAESSQGSQGQQTAEEISTQDKITASETSGLKRQPTPHVIKDQQNPYQTEAQNQTLVQFVLSWIWYLLTLPMNIMLTCAGWFVNFWLFVLVTMPSTILKAVLQLVRPQPQAQAPPKQKTQ